jgi:tetratricopeptide (TPR) repeat protein
VRRVLVAASLAALVCATAGVARADPRSDLEKAHNAYMAHRYDDAESRLRALLDPKTGALKDPDTIADARMYLGATLLAEKKNDEAAATFEELLIERPDYQADPLRVSLEAVDALTDARARVRDKLDALQAEKVRRAQAEKKKLEDERAKQVLRLAMLEKLASSELVIERHSRWLALVPFGVGQFQNGQTTDGWIFLVGEGLLTGASVVAAGLSVFYEKQAYTAAANNNASSASAYSKLAKWSAITDDLLVGGLAITITGGILHAEATFVPERIEMRKRDIPQLSLTPVVGPGGLGILGRF